MTISEEARARLRKTTRALDRALVKAGQAREAQGQALIDAYREGTTSMRELADECGISHQRIAQIMSEYADVETRDRLGDEILARSKRTTNPDREV